MAERVPLTGVKFFDEFGEPRVLVPFWDGESWTAADADGCSYWPDASHVRSFADGLARDYHDDSAVNDTINAYMMLADIIEEQTT